MCTQLSLLSADTPMVPAVLESAGTMGVSGMLASELSQHRPWAYALAGREAQVGSTVGTLLSALCQVAPECLERAQGVAAAAHKKCMLSSVDAGGVRG